MRLWEQEQFPAERLITTYDFDNINDAARDAENGRTVEAVLRMN